MRKLLTIVSLIALSFTAMAQTGGVDRLYIDTRGIFHLQGDDGDVSTQFLADHLNLNIFGHINDRINYRLRQRLNKQVFDEHYVFNATDFLYVNWQANDRWSFRVGKDAVLIGGYEYDAVPIDVYFYSKFCNSINQGFTFGASTAYKLTDRQTLSFQVCTSPLSYGYQGVYAYNFAWMGKVTDIWNTIWTTNFVQDMDGRFINYIALGNHFQWDNFLLDVDLMNRASFRQRNFFLTDYTVIVKTIWSVGDWNLCFKGGYETNSPYNVDSYGRPYDAVIAPGTEYLYAGAGVEYFPLGRDNIRLHAVYYRDNSLRRDNFDLGITWRIDIIRHQ
ncbi:MAG: hypothetical protein IKI13_05260 [Bacteroidales bacterium]|nr:hypothetical protein [Bacteroidales bacterium]